MTNCSEYRRALLADPRHPTPGMQAHASGCGECREFTERALRFEDRLAEALRVPLPDVPREAQREEVRTPPSRAHTPSVFRTVRRGGLAMAASLLLALVVGGLWLAAPRSGLAAAVVDHMYGEPDAWAVTDVAVPRARLDRVLSDAHLRLKADAPLVSYANSCAFRGYVVPHLVVQTPQGPVTVMVLVHEPVRGTMRFDEHGYRGVIVPLHGHGSLAVLQRGQDAGPQPVDQVVARVLRAIEWTD